MAGTSGLQAMPLPEKPQDLSNPPCVAEWEAFGILGRLGRLMGFMNFQAQQGPSSNGIQHL